MLLDDVAADFPGLTVILAHPSVPWQAEAISMAVHKSNLYIDLSGWSPKYFPAEPVRAAGGMLSGKVLFGSDYPLITRNAGSTTSLASISAPRSCRESSRETPARSWAWPDRQRGCNHHRPFGRKDQ
jgi:predicted TIM-barrel fold metal-dependent hydrolase